MERSSSYSEALKSSNIMTLVENKVYTNDLNKYGKFQISQSKIEGNELYITPNYNTDDITSTSDNLTHESDKALQNKLQCEDTDEEMHGIYMKIDTDNDLDFREKLLIGTRNNNATHSKNHNMKVDDNIILNINNEHNTIQNYTTEDNNISDNDIMANGDGGIVRSSIRSAASPIFPMQYSSIRKKHNRHSGGRRRRARRVVHKSGDENVPMHHHTSLRSVKYMRDVVNTLLNSQWRVMICIFIFSHFVFWMIFGLIWYGISKSYEEDLNDNNNHCIVGTGSFAGMLMMAVETQMTIGYGTRYPSEECPETIIIMVIEIIAGTALSGGLAGLFYAKLTRPQKHLGGVGFSKKAVVSLRDGKLCLMVRVWDLKNSHTINTNYSAYLLKPIRTIEGEHHTNFIHKLTLKNSGAFLLWPLTLVHVIDSSSPLYDVSAKDLLELKMEVVFCLTGASRSMGTVTQSRTSFLSREIMWGYRFPSVLNYDKTKSSYVIDMDNLDTVEQVDTPLCSARLLKEVCDDIENRPFVEESSLAESTTNNTFARVLDTFSEGSSYTAPSSHLMVEDSGVEMTSISTRHNESSRDSDTSPTMRKWWSFKRNYKA